MFSIISISAGLLLIMPFNDITTETETVSIEENTFHNVVCKMAASLSRPRCGKPRYTYDRTSPPSRAVLGSSISRVIRQDSTIENLADVG